MIRGVPPYPLPEASTVTAGPWQLHQDTGIVDMPQFLPDWDSNTDLHLARTIRVNVDEVRRQAALPPDAPLILVAEWASAAAVTADRACRRLVHDSRPVAIETKIAGELLGGALTVTTRVALAEDLPNLPPFTACRAGDVLYEDTARTVLQGSAGRLPTYVVDFAAAGFDPDARWHVELPVDLDEPAITAVRLYLNKAATEVVNAAARAASPTPVQRRILDWLEADLTSRLVEAALRADRRDIVADYADSPDSFGSAVNALLNNLFPGESAAALGARYDRDPGRFHSNLQGALTRMRAHGDDDAVSSAD